MFRRPRFVRNGFLVFGVLLLLLFSQVASALSVLDEAEMSATGEGTQEGAGSSHWVEWLAAFDKDGDKVDDEAESIASGHIAAGNPLTPVSVLINYAQMPGSVQVAELKGLGADPSMYVFNHSPTINVRVPASAVSNLGDIPGVVAVEYDYPIHPTLQVSAPSTQAREGTGANTFYNGKTAQTLGYAGQGMVVAVLDTGVNDQHAAFAGGKFVTGAVTSTPVIAQCINPVDDEGHGTHVASTVLGNSSPSVVGTAFSARLVEIKISAGPASIGGADRGFDWVLDYNAAIDNNAPMCGVTPADRIDVATLSFGSPDRGGPNAGTAEGLIKSLNESGVSVTIAVGNCGTEPSDTCLIDDEVANGDSDNGIASPGNAAGAISVASSFDENTVDRANDSISGFSSRGPVSSGDGDSAAGGATSAANLKDRYRKPDLAAPGEGIQAAGPAPFILSTSSGTSMATPHVAGIAALLSQAGQEVKSQTDGVNLLAPSGIGFDASNNYAQGVQPIRDALIHHSASYTSDYKSTGIPPEAQKWTGPNSAGLQWNNAWGYGQVNAFDALCWAWANVLVPGGATPTAAVSQNCDLGPPVLAANAGGPYTGQIGTTVTLTGSATGGTTPYAFAWSIDNGPGGGIFEDSTAAATTFIPDTLGTYTLRLTVTDTADNVASSTASLEVVAEPPTPQIQITSPADSAVVPAGVIPIEGFVDQMSGPRGGGTLFLVGDGTETIGADSPPPENRNFELSSEGNGGQQTEFTTAGSWNVDSWENPFTPTAVGNEPVRLSGAIVNLIAHVDYRFVGNELGNFCPLSAQLFSSAGQVLGAPGGVDGFVKPGLGNFREIVFAFNPTPGTYAGLGVQFSTVGVDCGTFSATWAWGTDEFPSRLVLPPDDALLDGPLGPGEERVELLLDGQPFNSVPVSTDSTNTVVDWASEVDLSGLNGSHSIEARWIEADGRLVDTDVVNVLVSESPIPVIHGPTALFTNEPGTFDGSDSRDPDGNVVSWEWDFGDGSSGTGTIVEHSWATAGDYTVTLRVTDNDGASSTATQQVTVSSPPQPGAGEKRIFAKSLQNHECVSTEWVFVITGIRGGISAPTSIHVTWGNRDQATIPLQGVSGGNAKYQTNLNLDSPVTEGAAVISKNWQGQFNLGRGPCF